MYSLPFFSDNARFDDKSVTFGHIVVDVAATLAVWSWMLSWL